MDVVDLSDIIPVQKTKCSVIALIADIMSLVLLTSYGKLGADIAVRFGISMGFVCLLLHILHFNKNIKDFLLVE